MLGLAAILLVGGVATPSVADVRETESSIAGDAVSAADGARVGQVVVHKRGDGTKPPAELGDPSEWGEAVLTFAPSKAFSSMSEACVPASGGNWCYGNYLTSTGKRCYSNYYHYEKTHKSSVQLGNLSHDSGWVGPNGYSNSSLISGAAFTCKTYYSIQ
ncbi:lactococcin 972 family bacteriocin [Streptomyces katrae]|uniref:lactococcin 972 family bacteriocin n=1 Tax=Streptomyces katrae TaxID=68223 RepID=UPI0033077EFB